MSPSWDDSEGIGPDIALLRLAAPLVLDGVSVAAARLPAESLGATWPEIGHELTVSGWGCTAEVGVDENTSDACESSWPYHLQSVAIRDISGPNGAAPCGDINPLAIAFTYEICAGVEAGGTDSCSAIAVDRWCQLRMESDVGGCRGVGLRVCTTRQAGIYRVHLSDRGSMSYGWIT